MATITNITVERSIEERELIERINWLTRLRWYAILAVIATVIIVRYFLYIRIDIHGAFICVIFLASYNALFMLYNKYLAVLKPAHQTLDFSKRSANLQIFLDLTVLTFLIHFSGGIENPFFLFFVFHIIIAGILLSRSAAFLQATLTIFLFCSMAYLEYAGIINHIDLYPFIPPLYKNGLYISGISFAFASTVYIAAYMTSSISRKLRRKGKELISLNAQLRQQDKLKSQYVLRVSHDIQSHLSVILTNLRIISEGYTGSIDDKTACFIETTKERAISLFRFVRDLLDLSSIRAQSRLKMKRENLSRIIGESIDDLRGKQEAKNLVIEFYAPDKVTNARMNKMHIKELLINLISNAIRYTKKGGKITVRLSESTEKFLVEVADTGIGIGEADRDKIFDEFYRAKNAKDAEKDGTGLGLAIAKQIALKHRGDIWFESELGRGTTFYVTISKIIKAY